MNGLPPAPRFEKKMHHVVPKAWQRKFSAPTDPGPYYKNVLTGECLPAQGPGDKMAELYANIVFDEHFRPTDKLEDTLSSKETKFFPSLDRMIATSVMDTTARIDVAYLLAVQACRYPEHFARRLDLGRYLAIAIRDCATLPNVAALNKRLQDDGLLPGANFTEAEFTRLSNASAAQREAELDVILATYGYESFYNPELIMQGALPVAEQLLGLEWKLIQSSQPAFLLSDRPMPAKIEHEFSVGLSATIGLRAHRPTNLVKDGENHPVPATQQEIDAINREVRRRAREWICGPGPWVHGL
jgi:hypothetical protein